MQSLAVMFLAILLRIHSMCLATFVFCGPVPVSSVKLDDAHVMTWEGHYDAFGEKATAVVPHPVTVWCTTFWCKLGEVRGPDGSLLTWPPLQVHWHSRARHLRLPTPLFPAPIPWLSPPPTDPGTKPIPNRRQVPTAAGASAVLGGHPPALETSWSGDELTFREFLFEESI